MEHSKNNKTPSGRKPYGMPSNAKFKVLRRMLDVNVMPWSKECYVCEN